MIIADIRGKLRQDYLSSTILKKQNSTVLRKQTSDIKTTREEKRDNIKSRFKLL